MARRVGTARSSGSAFAVGLALAGLTGSTSQISRPEEPSATRAIASWNAVLTGQVQPNLVMPRPYAPGGEAAADQYPEPKRLLQADVMVVGVRPLPSGWLRRLSTLPGVVAAVPVDAGRLKVNGVYVNVLGVSVAVFRPFAAAPTARSTALWQNVADGGMAVSYTMGQQDRLSLGDPVNVAGATTRRLPLAGFGTVGIGGVDAVVSDRTAMALGMQHDNAVVISAPKARLDKLIASMRKRAPAEVFVAALVTQATVDGAPVTVGSAGGFGITAAQGPGLTAPELVRFLTAAEGRVGMPYVWGAAGPSAFDCSGLVQWSLAQAGVTMPRVAADQARTGPLVPLSQLRPGDLLFYHTDPTAPDYISHVAIYLGNGLMLQAPQPGMDVQIVRADFGAGFAGAVRIYPVVAAAVAVNPAG